MASAHSWRRARKHQRIDIVSQRRTRSATRRLRFESLEERRLLSASSLDTTFAGTGFETTQVVAGADDSGYGMALQPDGKIVEVGFSVSSGVDSMALVRYNPDGSLDTTFGSGGKVTTMIGGQNTFGLTVAIQSDGKIVVGGDTLVSGVSEFTVARFNANGTLDTTFGTGGATSETIIAGQQSEVYSIKIDTSGRIVAAGYTFTSGLGGTRELIAARFTTTGALDTSFATGGLFLQNFGSGSNEADSIALGTSGTYVIGGDAVGVNQDFLVVRLTSTGQLDTTFNNSGSVIIDGNSSSVDTSETVLVDSNGSILDTGVGSNRAIMLRYTASGALDTTFAGTGKLVLPALQSGSSDEIVGAAFDQQHQIVIDGFTTASGVTSPFVDRVTSSGTLDPGFNGGNAVINLFGATSARAYVAAIDSAGRIVLAGPATVGGHGNFLVARLGNLPNASSLDTTFDTTGFEATQMGAGSSDDGDSIGVQPDGKVVVAGESYTSSVPSIALVRYNYDGSLDTTFGTGGKVLTMIGGQRSRAVSSSLVIQADGKIVIGGDTQVSGVGEFVVARYNANGTLDTTFGTGGSTTTTFLNGGQFEAAQIDSSGRIVASGFAYTNSIREFVVMRYTASGALDTTFASSGIFAHAFGAPNTTSQADGLTIESNGTIVVSGFDFNSSYDFLVVRLTSAGQLDTTFNGTGLVQTDINGQADTFDAVAVDSHGAILAGGESGNNAALVRYTASGALDTTFNGTGELLLPQVQSGSEDNFYSLSLQADGRIVGVGNSTVSGVSTTLVDRFNSDGSTDTSFNGGSPLLSLFGGTKSAAYAQAIDANGRIMLTGMVTVAGNQEILVARLGTLSTVVGNTLVLDGTANNDSLNLTFSSATAFAVTLNGTTTNYTVGTGAGQIDNIIFDGGAGSDTVNYQDTFNTTFSLLSGGTLTVYGAGTVTTASGTNLTARVQSAAPVIGGALANQPVNDNASVAPFAALTVTDPDLQTETATVTIANGTNRGDFTALSSAGWTRSIVNTVDIQYVETFGPATNVGALVQAAIRSLVFQPRTNAIASGTTESTSFTVKVDDGVAAPVSDSNTSVLTTSVNNAPVLTPAGPALAAIVATNLNGAGQTVGAIVGSSITDVDAGAVQGIAVIGQSAPAGAWQFSLDNGTSWSNFGSVSVNQSLLLRSTDRIRFEPDGHSALAATFSFRAWDQTAGTAGSTTNTLTTGGTTAFSSASDQATIQVNLPIPGATVSGNTLTIQATNVGNSLNVAFAGATSFTVTLNGVSASLTIGSGVGQISKVIYHGGSASDTVIYSDTANARLATMGDNALALVGPGFELDADNAELIYLYGQAADSATITDTTAGGNTAITTPTYAYLTNSGNTLLDQAASFGTVTIKTAAGSGDTGFQYSAAGTAWSATPTTSSMAGPAGIQTLVNFQHVYGQSAGGTSELAYLYGSSGIDTMIGTSTYAYLSGGSGATAYFNEAIGYHSVNAFGNGGADVANLYDSSGNDTYVSTPTYAYLTGGSGSTLFFNQAVGFPQVQGHSAGGADTAYFYDSSGNDTFSAQTSYASMVGTGYLNAGFGFKIAAGVASAGSDLALLYDAAGTNNFYGSNVTADLVSTTAGTERIATNFDSVDAVQSAGSSDHKFTQAVAYALTFTGTWI